MSWFNNVILSHDLRVFESNSSSSGAPTGVSMAHSLLIVWYGLRVKQQKSDYFCYT